MLEAHIREDGYDYIIEASWMPFLAGKYNYVAKLRTATNGKGKDVTGRTTSREEYGATPGEAIDKILESARAVFG
jgi:hypothetical protein